MSLTFFEGAEAQRSRRIPLPLAVFPSEMTRRKTATGWQWRALCVCGGSTGGHPLPQCRSSKRIAYPQAHCTDSGWGQKFTQTTHTSLVRKASLTLFPGLLPSGFGLLGLSRSWSLWILGKALSRFLSGGYRQLLGKWGGPVRGCRKLSELGEIVSKTFWGF